MRAIVRDRYGSPDVLALTEVEAPEAAGGEVLVRVVAAGVNMADVDYLRGQPYVARLGSGFRTPRNKILGLDVAGRVEAVGKDVTRFRPGDEVFGDLTEYGFGAFADYACASEDAFAPKPTTLTFEEAATVPQAAVMALQGLRGKRQIRRGSEVLVNGAGGNVGPFAVQIAKSFGAEVTAVDSAGKLDMVRSLGADHTIDYAEEDFTKTGRRYDWILDVAANHSVFACMRALKPAGTYVVIPDSMTRLFEAMLLGPVISLFSRRTLGMLKWKPFKKQDVASLTDLIEAGKIEPVIDRRYELSDVGEALKYQEAGSTKGKLVIAL
jgi:NADPH:quinone reductase-like Zn-dependent oxidoreductase